MYVLFDELSESARVWIYQADRKLSADELTAIEKAAMTFVDGWAAHGAPLKGSFKVLHNQFLVILADESFNSASGCSIDASVHFVQQLEQQLGISFFDRSKVAFIHQDEVFLESLNHLKDRVSEGVIHENTLVFNNLVKDKKELEHMWLIPAGQTWLGRYFD